MPAGSCKTTEIPLFLKKILSNMILFDNHNHSHHSADSRMNMLTAAEESRKKAFRGICFSDHYDFDPHRERNRLLSR